MKFKPGIAAPRWIGGQHNRPARNCIKAGQLIKLSARQRAVLDGIAEGKKRSAIAADLGLSLSAVNRHAEKIFQRLACHTGAAAVAKFLRLPIPASTRPKRPSARKSTR